MSSPTDRLALAHETLQRPPPRDHGRPSRVEAEAAFRTILRWAGDDPAREGLLETPARMTRAFEEYFAGYGQDPAAILAKTFDEIEGYDGMIVLRGVRFESHCEHHMAPIIGRAWVGYVPEGRVIGISKLARVVEVFAKRLQIQERMTAEIANTINAALKPKGVGVLITAVHHCMTARGVQKPDTDLVTTRMMGCFRDDRLTRQEFLRMDAPYEVITNLLRFRLGKGYSPNPFIAFLTEVEQKGFKKRGISTLRKIEILKKLSGECGLNLGAMFDEFYNNRLRNAISHADYILTDEDFRCRGDISGIKGFRIAYEDLDRMIMCAKAFISAFLQVELMPRQVWGMKKKTAMPYDQHYKGLMEILVDDRDVMCGFRVHWPNNSQSTYRRAEAGVDMTNCMLDLKNATINFFVDLYAQNPGEFSPLVERDGTPLYTRLEGCDERPTWPNS